MKSISIDEWNSSIYMDNGKFSLFELTGHYSVASLYVTVFGSKNQFLFLSYDFDGSERWYFSVYDTSRRDTVLSRASGVVGHVTIHGGNPLVAVRNSDLVTFLEFVEVGGEIDVAIVAECGYRQADWTILQYLHSELNLSEKSMRSLRVCEPPTIFRELESDHSELKKEVFARIEHGKRGRGDLVQEKLYEGSDIEALNKYFDGTIAQSSMDGTEKSFIPFYFDRRWVRSRQLEEGELRSFRLFGIKDDLIVEGDSSCRQNSFSHLLNKMTDVCDSGDIVHTASASFLEGVIISRSLSKKHNLVVHKGDISRVRSNFPEGEKRDCSRGTLIVVQASNDSRVDQTNRSDMDTISRYLGMDWFLLTYGPGGHVNCPPILSSLVRNFQTFVSLPEEDRKDFFDAR